MRGALECLEGLSVGDALGESLSYRYYGARQRCDYAALRDGSVRYTDDTEMAIVLVEQLAAQGLWTRTNSPKGLPPDSWRIPNVAMGAWRGTSCERSCRWLKLRPTLAAR